jgi:hypothetical protein
VVASRRSLSCAARVASGPTARLLLAEDHEPLEEFQRTPNPLPLLDIRRLNLASALRPDDRLLRLPQLGWSNQRGY